MKLKMTLLAALLTCTAPLYAFPTQPSKCPDADKIAAAGLSKDIIEKDFNGQWIVLMPRNNYKTVNSWSFIISKIDAENREEAYTKAVNSLQTLTFDQGPYQVSHMKKWGCRYHTSENFLGVTVTPDLQGNP